MHMYVHVRVHVGIDCLGREHLPSHGVPMESGICEIRTSAHEPSRQFEELFEPLHEAVADDIAIEVKSANQRYQTVCRGSSSVSRRLFGNPRLDE